MVPMKFKAKAIVKKGEWVLVLKDGETVFAGEGLESITDLMDRLRDEMTRRGWTEIEFEEMDDSIDEVQLVIHKEVFD